MDINSLFKLEIGDTVRVFNEVLTLVGRSTITLEGEEEIVWLFDENNRMLAVSPAEEELVLFEAIDEELEPDGEGVLYQGNEYEFNYEDSGTVTDVEGDSVTEPEDRYLFTDYQAKSGNVLRIVSNENTGEVGSYYGQTVSEEDLSEA